MNSFEGYMAKFKGRSVSDEAQQSMLSVVQGEQVPKQEEQYMQEGGFYNNSLRPDGTFKGQGYYGEIPTKDGRVMTELTTGFEIDGEEVEIPLLVSIRASRGLHLP